MRELRLSIPIIGGVTAIYTEVEVKAAKARMHKHVADATQAVKRGAIKGLNLWSDYVVLAHMYMTMRFRKPEMTEEEFAAVRDFNDATLSKE